jgi:hypothetical protein
MQLERFGNTTEQVVQTLKDKPKEAKWLMIKMQQNFNVKQKLDDVGSVISQLYSSNDNPTQLVVYLKKLAISISTNGGKWFAEFIKLKGLDVLLSIYVMFDR